MINYLVMY